ncbi:MAG: DUF1013 domain-containing protein [Alphaproteobacteria bacterium]|jgi:uncharacterized protein|nr:DUF1013 domain-containing protein [Alphaproteobacteria bacterium]MBT7942045.1 DUF1013 domain-containing protein [Alphaproteobacteria bacterium]
MVHPLMPKATAVWLVENTALTFNQIAEFCGLHDLEVQAIADDEVAMGMQGLDPVACGELTQEELDRCIADPSAKLEKAKPNNPLPKARQKGARYTPVSKRQDRPDAIAWLVKNHPELSDAQISKLIGTTKPTINAIRERSHWNMPNIKPQNPVALGLCVTADLEKVVAVARKKAGMAVEPVEPIAASSTPSEVALSLKPGEVVLLKGEATAERERALELESETPVFDTTVPEESAPAGSALQDAEDVFAARPAPDA